MLKTRKTHFHIVGGGILGVLTAKMAAEIGHSVVVYRLSDASRPSADSLRNHAWLQSGLLYGDRLPKSSLLRMRHAGLRLLDEFLIPEPVSSGIFRLAGEDEAERLLTDAEMLRASDRVLRIPDNEARQQLGAFYKPGFPHFAVPDSPFPEGRIIQLARDRAKSLGTRFVNLRVPVRLRSIRGSDRFLLDIDGRTVEPDVLVLAAGSRTPTLLSGLGLEPSLIVSQSPLMVLPGYTDIAVPLFVDRSSGLTVIRHLPYAKRREGCLVIGNTHRREIHQRQLESRRCVSSADQQSIYDLLPPALLRYAQESQAVRFTAGHKTELFRPGIGCTVEPWIEQFPEFPGLFAAIPGKATLALSVAEDLVRLTHDYLAERTLDAQTFNGPSMGSSESWSGPVSLHHEEVYDALNEAN